MKGKCFVTAVNCMDGRVQLPVIEWLRDRYKADYVDMITEAGPNRILSDDVDSVEYNLIRKRVELSLEKHGSRLVAVIGHYDCGGNPADKDTQIKQIKKAVDNIKTWSLGVDVIGLYVDEHWYVKKVV
ncbi:MAG: hypothetical protein QXS02_05735 [Candidatus Thermoplasmatota archaeon]